MQSLTPELPVSARTKLQYLADDVQAAWDALQACQRRLSTLQNAEKELDHDAPEQQRAALKADIERLASSRERLAQDHRARADVVAALNDFLHRLSPGTTFKCATKIRIVIREPLNEALGRVRDEVRKLKSELTALERAQPDVETMKRLASEYIAELAARRKPKIRCDFRKFEADFAAEHYAFNSSAVAAMMAWLDGAALEKRLHEAIDDMQRHGLAVSPVERDERMAVLREEILGLERNEEAIIECALDDGFMVARRADANPLAILGLVKVDTKRKVAA